MCNDLQSLNAAYNSFINCKNVDNFPQGVDFIETFFKDKIESIDTIIILSNKTENSPTTWFYFPFTKYSDLRYLSGHILFPEDLEKEIENMEKYKEDIYPQGIDYCKKLLNEKFEQNIYPYLIWRPIGETYKSPWTKYYFKEECILQNGTIKSLNILCGATQLQNEIRLIQGNNTRNLKQGNEYCIDIINKELQSNGKIIVICSKEYDTKNDVWLYFPYDKIDLLSNEDWRVESDRIEKEINLINYRNKGTKYCFPQGSQYCIQLLEDLYENGETSHLLIIKREKLYCFYFKE